MAIPSKDHKSDDLGCKVYIGGLGHGADSKEIESVFRQFGKVQSVWVARHPPGFAFVAFEDSRDASDAVRCLDGTKLNGKRVRVEKSSGESRWEKWNLPPPDASSFHGVTLDYKGIREAILLRKQLRVSRSLGGNRRSSSRGHRLSRNRRSRSNDSAGSCSNSENHRSLRRREKFRKERSQSGSNRRPEAETERRRRTRRTRTRTGKSGHVRRSYDNTSSSRSSSSDRDHNRKRSKSRSKPRSRSRSRSKSLRKVDDGKKDVAVPAQNGDLNENTLLSKQENESKLIKDDLEKCPKCRPEIRPETRDASTQTTEFVTRQTTGTQCRLSLIPRKQRPRPRTIRIRKVKPIFTRNRSSKTSENKTTSSNSEEKS